MSRKLSYRSLIGVLILSLSLLGGVVSTVYGATHEQPPDSVLVGPPIAGNLTLYLTGTTDCMASDDNGVCIKKGLLVDIEFSGCCADCFDVCRQACNVKVKRQSLPFPIVTYDNNHDGNFTLEDLRKADFDLFYLPGWAPKGCNSNPLNKDVIIEKALQLTLVDLNKDGINELIVQTLLLYVVPISQ